MKYIKKFEKVEYADPMITLFEDFNDLDFFKNQNQDYYTEVDLHKLGFQLTYSTFNREGDKEYKWRAEAMKMIKELFTNKVVTIKYNDDLISDLVENVSTYDDVDVPILRMKFGKLKIWKTISTSKPFIIWNDDSETAKQVRLEIEAKKYNL